MPRSVQVQVYTDGENVPDAWDVIKQYWEDSWNADYTTYAQISFLNPINLKTDVKNRLLPPKLRKVSAIRNPDLYFTEVESGVELGGIEITTHSPDGSNVEKRYPYLWISRALGVAGFTACPYQKWRPGGAVNRLPRRHVERNSAFLDSWDIANNALQIQQITPTVELQSRLSSVPTEINQSMFRWRTFGELFSHLLATQVFSDEALIKAREKLITIRTQLKSLEVACLANTNFTDPTSLLKLPDRWIQVYNTRPDSGHWERGEGQFDSIDGRLMFTLDEIALLPPSQRPAKFEFWLPQVTGRHPWVVEQRSRGYGSKRFRNIMEILEPYCEVRFAEDLSSEDWLLLVENRGLLLERLDWSVGVYKVSDLVGSAEAQDIARRGLKNPAVVVLSAMEVHLLDQNLYFSSHRAYIEGWRENLYQYVRRLPNEAVVLVPRIPRHLLTDVAQRVAASLLPAEECVKSHLMMLRQLHRNRSD